jgi:multidrug efflux pump subunit AcrA (membrane-fusion protein)
MRHELISSRFWTLPAAIGLIGLLGACAAPVMLPSTQMTNARASIAQAESAGATQRAPVELLAARDKLARAEAAARAENFTLAERLSDQAQADAELAERKSRAVKAQTAADELAQSNTLLRQELERKTMR